MGLETHGRDAPGGEERDQTDFERLRHARARHLGFAVGQYLQPPPMLFTRDGHNVFLGDMYRGCTAFLIGGGPSLKTQDLTQLSARGILTLAVNNAAAIVRPNLWCCVDDPGNFADAIWRDPGIMKFIPLCHMEKRFAVRNQHGELIESSERTGDMPAVFGFRRNEAFVADQFLREDSFNWGNHGRRTDDYGIQGSRSVMYVAIRLLYYLGVRRVFLLGCDFRMTVGGENYAFTQDRSAGSVSGNNNIYHALNTRLQHLKPEFEAVGFEVFNATPNSGLTVFPQIRYEDAVAEATAAIPTQINTSGMYDRQARERSEKQRTPHDADAPSSLVFADQLPPLSIVVPVHSSQCDVLAATWRTWMHFKPWMKQFPILFVRDAREPARIELARFARDHGRTSVVDGLLPRIRTSASQDWAMAQLNTVTRHVQTPWYWLLDPATVATGSADWLHPNLFQVDQTGEHHALIGHPWSYAKPADVFQRMDEWGSHIAELQDFPELGWTFDATSDRILRDTVSTWSLLARTDWTRTIYEYAKQHPPPCGDLANFLVYCAERRRDRWLRLSMKQGWEHSYSWAASRVRSRCQEVLAIDANPSE